METKTTLPLTIFDFFETEFLCVTVLAVLELILIDQVSLKITRGPFTSDPKCWDYRLVSLKPDGPLTVKIHQVPS